MPSLFSRYKTRIPTPEDALPGRSDRMPVPARHRVLDAPLEIRAVAAGVVGVAQVADQVDALVRVAGIDHVAVSVDNLDETLARLRAEGVTVLGALHHVGGSVVLRGHGLPTTFWLKRCPAMPWRRSRTRQPTRTMARDRRPPDRRWLRTPGG